MQEVVRSTFDLHGIASAYIRLSVDVTKTSFLRLPSRVRSERITTHSSSYNFVKLILKYPVMHNNFENYYFKLHIIQRTEIYYCYKICRNNFPLLLAFHIPLREPRPHLLAGDLQSLVQTIRFQGLVLDNPLYSLQQEVLLVTLPHFDTPLFS